MKRKKIIAAFCAVAAALCAVVLLRFNFGDRNPVPESAAETESTFSPDETEETGEPETVGIFLKITILYPDGTAYESMDDGETWAVNGEPAEKPILSAFFVGDLPVLLSEGCRLYVYNDTGAKLYYGNAFELLRESGGEWIPADGGYDAFTQELLTLPERIRWRFDVPTEIYEPVTGKYRYIREFDIAENYPNGGTYTVILEFTADQTHETQQEQ